MEIKNKTTLSRNNTRTYYNFNFIRTTLPIFIAAVLLLALGIVGFILDNNRTFSIIAVCFAGGIPLIVVIMEFTMRRTLYRRINNFAEPAVYEYIFKEKEITINTVIDKMPSTQNFAYSVIYRIYESKSGIYIFTNKTAMAYICEKSGFASADDLAAAKQLLSAKMGSSFKQKKSS